MLVVPMVLLSCRPQAATVWGAGDRCLLTLLLSNPPSSDFFHGLSVSLRNALREISSNLAQMFTLDLIMNLLELGD